MIQKLTQFLWVLIATLLFTAPKAEAQKPDGCSLSGWVMQQQPHSTRTTELPATDLRDTVVTINGTSHKISIPPGFTMTVFANVDQCRGLACSPDGVIYATSYNGNVYALPDHDHVGKPDSIITVATGLGDPHGIGFYKGDLYVSNNSSLYRMVTGEASRVAIGKVQIAALPISGGHHSRNFVIDTVYDKIYLQVGSNGNIDTTDIEHRAQIVEMNIDGSDYRTFARGVRNGVGMDLDPRTDVLWVNNNGMDDIFGSGTTLTANNPSESVYIVCDGANYGWPWCYGFRMRNPLMLNLDTSIVQTFNGPVAEVLAHEAPLGLHFYRGTKFPPLYHNAIFQCYHGSWDRVPPAPPRITVMWADQYGRNASVTDFVNGFQPDSNDSRWGRVVSLIEGSDSALYASDDQAGVIYRIAYTGATSDVAENSSNLGFKLGSPVPNPAGNGIHTDLTLEQPSLVIADVFDSTGNRVKPVMDSEMDTGKHSLKVDTSQLLAGNYTLRVATCTGCTSCHFVIQR